MYSKSCSLQAVKFKFNIYGPVVPRLKRVLSILGCREIIDLGSGGSGPILLVQERLKNKEGYPAQVTLTDLSPNIESLKKRARNRRRISPSSQPP